MITDQQRELLTQAAINARERAYAVYSKYQVGAALLCADGEIVTGCNVENASYGLTICAERTAVFTAVAQGRREFNAIAIATADGGPPCGACRQVLAEFCSDMPFLLVSTRTSSVSRQISLSDLLPMRFDMEDR